MQTLLDDVIALTRDDDDQLEDEDCDPLQTARAVARLLQPRAWEKRLRLTLTAAPDLPRVAADPRRVRQALLKIADNALKFTDRGLVDIRLDAERDENGHAVCALHRLRHRPGRGAGSGAVCCSSLSRPAIPPMPASSRARAWAWRWPSASSNRRAAQIGFESQPGRRRAILVHPAGFRPGRQRAAGAAARRSAAGGAARPFASGLSRPRPMSRRTIANLLEPFGNRVVIAASAADAAAPRQPGTFRRHHRQRRRRRPAGRRARREGAADRGAAARRPRRPAPPTCVLRWPVDGRRALSRHRRGLRRPAGRRKTQAELPAAIDAVAFSTLEKSVGVKTLIEILQCYIVTAEQLTNALAEACAEEKWDEAARLAQDIVGAAGGLGLAAVTQAARHFAQKSREGEDRHELRNAAQMVVGEHVRARQALTNLYPDVA